METVHLNNDASTKHSQHQDTNDSFNFNGRFYETNECLYNLVKSSSPSLYTLYNYKTIQLILIILQSRLLTFY